MAPHPRSEGGAGCSYTQCLLQYLVAALLCAYWALLSGSSPLLRGNAGVVEAAGGGSTFSTLPAEQVQQALDRQSSVIKNLTLRLHTAEVALQFLEQDRQKAKAKAAGASAASGKSSGKSSSKSTVVAGPSSEASAAGEGPSSEAAAGPAAVAAEEKPAEQVVEEESEEGEKTKEEREEEEKEQFEQIQYDPIQKTYRRWRPDFKCGPSAPLLPDGEEVECLAASEAPCCSSLGWCGKTRNHCKCHSCTDYRKKEKEKKDSR